MLQSISGEEPQRCESLLELDDRDVVMIQRLPLGTGARAIQSVCRSSGMLVKSSGSAYITILAHLETVLLFLARRGCSACTGLISIWSNIAFVSGSRFSSSLLSLRDRFANELMFLDESTCNNLLCRVRSDIRTPLRVKVGQTLRCSSSNFFRLWPCVSSIGGSLNFLARSMVVRV